MGWWLWALVAIAKGLGFIPNTHIVAHFYTPVYIYTPVSEDLLTFKGTKHAPGVVLTYRQPIHADK